MTLTEKFLVADIGGTNTRVGLADRSGLIESSTRRYRNSENESFEAVLKLFIEEMQPSALRGACAGAAGLVVDGVAYMTNLEWAIDQEVMAKVSGAPVVNVINDLQAQGFALDSLLPEACQTIVSALDQPQSARLVVGLGTGFNIVPVHHDNDRLIVPSCEAGHATLPYSAAHAPLLEWLQMQKKRATVERALAGQGLQNIYEFHTARRADASDIMQALSKGDDGAKAAMHTYAHFLGAVIGDLALEHLPFGGIYLTGGVARSVTPHLQDYGFLAALRDKDDFAELMEKFSVTLIQDDFAALKGCARYLSQHAL